MTGSTLARLVSQFKQVRLLCVGDVMLDRFVYGTVERISPEAPIPVVRVARDACMIGGAGNVARNAVALGANAILVGVVGDDNAARDLAALGRKEPRLEMRLITARDRTTTVKERYVAGGQQLLRADREDTGSIADVDSDHICSAAENAMPHIDIVVLSDYAKGTLTAGVIARISKSARQHNKRVIADPKHQDFSRYSGAHILTPNASELAQATSLPTHDDRTVETASAVALGTAFLDAIVVTRSAQGMTLLEAGRPAVHVRAQAREVFDVSGAGDTAIAVLALSSAAGGSLQDAVQLANAAAGIVVGKSGTAVITSSELLRSIQAAELTSAESKVVDDARLLQLVHDWRDVGLSVGFTNGCFDLLHLGHVSLLKQARTQCDRLIVGLNTDSSVRKLKGETRPINNEFARGIVLAALETVDAVVMFDEDTPIRLIEAIKPDVLIKGADYRVEEVVGAEFVHARGGRVVLAALTPGASTTGMIGRIRPPAVKKDS